LVDTFEPPTIAASGRAGWRARVPARRAPPPSAARAGNERESRNSVRGRFRAVRAAEGVVHIDVAKRGDFPGQAASSFFSPLLTRQFSSMTTCPGSNLHAIYPIGNQRNFNT